MSNIKIYMIAFLIISNISFSFGIVWLEHLNRSQYRELQFLSNQKYILKTEWRKVRVEKRKYDSLSIVEKAAQEELKMFIPNQKMLITINE